MALPRPKPDDAASASIAAALRTLASERDGLAVLMEAIGNGLGEAFAAAVDLIAAAHGRVIVTGMGKSGHIGRKIAATLASTGTPAYYVHPGEASHGDLGVIHPSDVIVALSWSGETAELSDLIAYAKRFRVGLVAITAHARSTLGRQADVCCSCRRRRKPARTGWRRRPRPPCNWRSATRWPWRCSSSAASVQDFRVYHPGGKLGAQLKLVRDVMHTGERLPLIDLSARMDAAILEMSAKGFGCVIVVESDGSLAGIVTDGDLRRHMRPTSPRCRSKP